MRNQHKYLLCLLAFVLLCGAVFCVYDKQNVFQGECIKNPDCYMLQFQKMNQTDSHTLTLHAGESLSVDFDIERGHAALSIGMEGLAPVYSGKDIKDGKFSVTVPEDGAYQITVIAKHASGCISASAVGNHGAQNQ